MSTTQHPQGAMGRREFLGLLAGGAATALLPGLAWGARGGRRHPNFVIIFCDDLGYRDLACYGAPEIRTPRLDRLAAEGMRFTDFYSAACVCTPSRAALLTGCYPARVNLPNVLHPQAQVGISADEITLAELLRTRGYATACIGKWHLGHLPPFLPTRHGFDEYFGIPYSNDMKPTPLMRGEETIEEPAVQETLTERYTQEAIRFMTSNRDRPFFLYLPHSMPHVPLHVSERFRGKSGGGLYGDVVECLDWSTGETLDTLARLGIERNTLVVFTSDNGPWLIQGENGGCALPLRDGKGTSYEGGMREPCLMRWPGRVPPGAVCTEMATMMDLYPTLAGLAGAEPPKGRIVDGKDILPLITGKRRAKTPHEAFFYYRGYALDAVRSGEWKLVLERTERPRNGEPRRVPEALYNVRTDVAETTDVSTPHPDVVARLRALAERCRDDLGDQRQRNPGKNRRLCGHA